MKQNVFTSYSYCSPTQTMLVQEVTFDVLSLNSCLVSKDVFYRL